MAASLFKWLILLSHPLYITVTDINHNAKDKTLEISCKMFTNDFEAVLERAAHSKVDLSDTKNKAATDKLIADYVQKHLQLKLDGRSAVIQFVGSEKEEDGTWSYFQVTNIPSVKKIDVSNSLLYDNFSQEINIMHASVGGVKKSTRLDYPASAASFEF
jgi:hypothetical protein